MVLTVRQILIAVDSGALKRLATQPVPAVAAWKLYRLLRALEAEYGAATAARLRLMTEANSVPIHGGTGRMVKPECAATFEADPVFAETVRLDVEPLSVALLEGAVISASDMDLIAPLLTD